MLFEVDLGAATEATTLDMAKSLELIARQSILEEELDRWGERVFTDGRVRTALGQLAAHPNTSFLNEVGKLLGKPEISTSRLQESLARVLDAESLGAHKRAEHKPKPPGGIPLGGGKEYALDHHLAGKPAAIKASRTTRSLRAGARRRCHAPDTQTLCRLLRR